MKILWIDPSIANLWIAVFEWPTLLQAWTIKTKTEWADRYLEIANKIKNIVLKYKPDVLAIESQYVVGLNSNAVLKTCEVKWVCRAVFMLLVPNGVVVDIAPSEAKKVFWIKWKRKEAKKQVVEEILKRYKFSEKIDDNTADAICIGLAGLQKF